MSHFLQFFVKHGVMFQKNMSFSKTSFVKNTHVEKKLWLGCNV
jgi:hypothetical protein